MKPQVGDLRTVTQRFDGEQWVLCLQLMPTRELSDEEIYQILSKELECVDDEYLKRSAKAILKKASEK